MVEKYEEEACNAFKGHRKRCHVQEMCLVLFFGQKSSEKHHGAGTRDFGPDEYRLRQWLFGEFEAVSRLFGFEQFETPVLESEELFIRKAGEEITGQLYSFEVSITPS